MALTPFRLFIHKWVHWEYWPFWILYIPIYGLWAYYALRARSLFFFSAVNPSIKNGGFVMESKKAIYELLPKNCYPRTILIEKETVFAILEAKMEDYELVFPVIAKPDIGLRGAAVKKIIDIDALKTYHDNISFDYLIQDFIEFPKEIGVFYVRYPGEKEGRITGIVNKENLSVTGDGTSTLESLICENPRFQLQLKALQGMYSSMLNTIPAKSEKIALVPYGSHCRGAMFTDCSDLITEKLTQSLDKICAQIPGFYYGRLDIMFTNFNDLEAGKNFTIVEVNGAKSEPTHMYDPRHTVLYAWRELARHISYMYEISRLNYKTNTASYLDFKEGMAQMRAHFIQDKRLNGFQSS
ncbi:MAG TPA: D-alanine--D-alanine ligase [Leeuwenhoekiella sp.]|nr:D-alanine--D-alanine ligase [Leeuwenhoekiella sp.]